MWISPIHIRIWLCLLPKQPKPNQIPLMKPHQWSICCILQKTPLGKEKKNVPSGQGLLWAKSAILLALWVKEEGERILAHSSLIRLHFLPPTCHLFTQTFSHSSPFPPHFSQHLHTIPIYRGPSSNQQWALMPPLIAVTVPECLPVE